MSERDPWSLHAQPLSGRGLGMKLSGNPLIDAFLLFLRGLRQDLVLFYASPSPKVQ